MHLASADSGNFGMDYQEVLRINQRALDAMVAALQGTGKPLVTTAGTLTVAPDPSGAETTESSPPQPNPINDRWKAEVAALKLADKGIRVSSIRLAPWVYGRGGSGVALVMQMSAKSGGVICVNEGVAYTSTVHVDDAAKLYLLAAKKARAGDVFNATGSKYVTFRQLADAMGSVLQLPVRLLPFDVAAANISPFLARFLSAENKASSAKAARELGWGPQGVEILEDIRNGSYKAVAAALKRANP